MAPAVPGGIVPSVRAALRRRPFWMTLQSLRREGFGNAWYRWRVAPKILETSPIATYSPNETTPCETHLLIWDRDLLPAFWAAKTFYATASVDWPLYFHQGGPLGATAQRRIREHFPNARLVATHEADQAVEAALSSAGNLHLLEARRQSFMLRKLVDPVLFGRAPRMLLLDTDVLFFQHPTEIVDAAAERDGTAVFNRDQRDWYSVDRATVRERVGIELPECVNAGLAVVARSSLDLAVADSWLAALPELISSPWLAEQTIQALFAGRSGMRYLPETYALSKEPGLTTPQGMPLRAKHYVSHPRPLLYREGIPHVIRTHVLKGL